MQVEFSGRDDAGYVTMTSAHRPGPPSFQSVLGWSVADARRLAANSTTPLVVLWCIGFITGSILLFAAYLLGVAPRLGTAGTDLAALGMLAGFSGMLSLGAAAVRLAVILLRVTRWQEARALLAGGGLGSPLVGRSAA